MNNRAFIFDIDGTLVNLRTMWKQTYTFLYQREHNYTLSEAEIKSMFGSPELECPDVILRQLGLYTRERAAEMVRRTEDIMLLTLSRENVSKYIPHGVIPCLQELQRAHAAVGCATGNTEAVAKSILHHSGLEEYFPVLAYSTGETASRTQIVAKAKQELERHYQREFELRHTYVIGDTPADVGAARDLGFKSIAIASGEYWARDLALCGPDTLILDLRALSDLVAALPP